MKTVLAALFLSITAGCVGAAKFYGCDALPEWEQGACIARGRQIQGQQLTEASRQMAPRRPAQQCVSQPNIFGGYDTVCH